MRQPWRGISLRQVFFRPVRTWLCRVKPFDPHSKLKAGDVVKIVVRGATGPAVNLLPVSQPNAC